MSFREIAGSALPPQQAEQQQQQAQLQQRVNSVTAAMVAADACPTSALQAAADTDWAALAQQLKQPTEWYADVEVFHQFVSAVRVRVLLAPPAPPHHSFSPGRLLTGVVQASACVQPARGRDGSRYVCRCNVAAGGAA